MGVEGRQFFPLIRCRPLMLLRVCNLQSMISVIVKYNESLNRTISAVSINLFFDMVEVGGESNKSSDNGFNEFQEKDHDHQITGMEDEPQRKNEESMGREERC